MLSVRIEHPRDGTIGLMEIRNDGTLSTDGEDSPRGAYDYTLFRKSSVGKSGQLTQGHVEYDRAGGAWGLVRSCIEDSATRPNANEPDLRVR
jgi:hypothetical protein